MSNIGSYEKRYKNFDWSLSKKEMSWDENGMINIGYLCADRNCDLGLADKTALIWESFTEEEKRYTFNDIRIYSNNFARFFKDLGISPGERVCIFLDKIPALYIGMLGVLKTGAIAQPLFSAFGEEALFTRLEDAATSAILTSRKHIGKVRRIRDRLPALKYVVVVDGEDMELKAGEYAFNFEKATPVEKFECYKATTETPSLLHYTSGTTGKPKGALHVHGSAVAQYITTKWVLDLQPNDLYWCTADPGWVTGTSYGIIGPWCQGATQLVLEIGFIPERWYKAIEKHKVTVFYSAPTAIRMLMKEGEQLVRKFDLSSLRHLVSVGEPLNAEAVLWSEKVMGLPFHDSYWQTETGCIVISNYPDMKIKPGSMGKPFPGIVATIVDPKEFKPISHPGSVGLIALQPGWPAMFRNYWNNEETYKSKFKNGWYICGDRASIDEEGYFWFVGRDDDVINTAGHLVGPFEIESALLEHPAIAESAAIGKPDPVNMEVVKAFIALKPGHTPSDELKLDIINFVRKRLSPLAMPQEIEFRESLPKTRSGKLMRRLLKAQETGEEIGDISTLEND